MIFDLEKYTDRNLGMHCDALYKARIFCKFLNEQGRLWIDGVSYLDRDFYDTNKKNTVYVFNQGKYGDVNRCQELNIAVLEFDDFDWSSHIIQFDDFMQGNLDGWGDNIFSSEYS